VISHRPVSLAAGDAAQAARRAPDARLRVVLGSLSGPAVQLDSAGAVTFVNESFLDATGWARGEVLGAEWCEHFVPAGCVTRFLFDGATDAAVRGEGEVFARDGNRRVVAWDIVPVHDHAGLPAGLIAVGRDVTEERRGARERARLVRAVAALADRDELTGLLNAHGFARIAEHAARVAARMRRTDALVRITLDDLDASYAAYGEAAADDAVCAVAEALRAVVRDSDVIARVAPDVFVVYAFGTATPGHGASTAERVRAALADQNVRAGAAGRTFDLAYTVRAVEREPGDSVDQLLGRAAAAGAPGAAAVAGEPDAPPPAPWEAADPFAGSDPLDGWDARPSDD
jgi:diguanylate cyclase (GGDEF)-like protein/PAS domain S-box-containing protein